MNIFLISLLEKIVIMVYFTMKNYIFNIGGEKLE